MKTIIFTGGGTTGHVMKNIIVLEALKKSRTEMEYHYIGVRKGKEAQLIPGKHALFHSISAGKLRRYFSLETIPDFFRTVIGICQSFWLLGRLKPHLIFSSGGYVAFPVCFSAWLRRIPIITHETDTYPGLANRMIARFATKVLLGFRSAESYFDPRKIVYTGTPVSPNLFKGSREQAAKHLCFSLEQPILLVMGGSQGSEQINDMIREILPKVLEYWQVIHLTGKSKNRIFEKSKNTKNVLNINNIKSCHYRKFEYVTNEYADFLNAADLVICRGGGNSLAEIAALGKQAIVIPLLSAAGDHQRRNALEMAMGKKSWIVLDNKGLKSEDLLLAVKKYGKSVRKHSPEYSSNSIQLILEVIFSVLRGH